MTDIFLYLMIADPPPRIEASQPEGSGESGEPCGNTTPGTSPTAIYHDPNPPFETDGRGRVVWSNSSEQARLRLRPSQPVQPQKSGNDEATITRGRENGNATSQGTETGDGNDDG